LVQLSAVSFIGREAVAQSAKEIELPITVRVDTSNSEILAVYHLWKNYLNSRPDSIYANPYWSEGEKRRYSDCDFARAWVYSSSSILHAYPPKLLSITQEDSAYVLRTLYYAENLEEPYRSSNPWAIQRVYARREGGAWKLFNPLPVLTKAWNRQQIGRILFVYSREDTLDVMLARQSARFCDSLIEAFGLPAIDTIEFYVTRHADDLARIIGLDFALGATMGRSNAFNAQVFSAFGTPWYPHELVHVLFAREFPTHFMLGEGIATWLGGAVDKSASELMKQLDAYLTEHPELTFEDLLDQPYLEGSTALYYAAGAVWCSETSRIGGASAVKRLLSHGTTADDLYAALKEILGLYRGNVMRALRERTRAIVTAVR
jgi:hypothetical protein